MNKRPLGKLGFAFVLFGGTGDLAKRKILPALFAAHRDGMLEPACRIVAVAQPMLARTDYLDLIGEPVKANVQGPVDVVAWDSFVERVSYIGGDLSDADVFARLAEDLRPLTGSNVFYLATGPSLFVPVCRALAASGLSEGAKLVLEKPLGHDLESSRAINDEVGRIFREDQIFRIDHYLGKEAVQNLLALRFGNSMFEPLWRREWIESIQITVAEELGVEGRGNFYDQTGALRDMIQNHLLQLLSIIAMEPPHSMEADAVRDEKLRVLRALVPLDDETVARNVVRGQYQSGTIHGAPVPEYQAEAGVGQGSDTETFVALKVEISNWRWSGVPFFLRTGKRLGGKTAEIIVNFRGVPHSALGTLPSRPGANRLTIKLQPEESIRLSTLAKMPGLGMELRGVNLDMVSDGLPHLTAMEAYQRLLLDVMAGRLALFVRRDEQEAAWQWVAPILSDWSKRHNPPKQYRSGTWGPPASSALLARHNTCWHEEA
ncbi:glucose-6-phosphate dehydrogenase [Paraburkholderia sp. HD33-4]|uniref:glucose-6-phosphate dehydrogenase n=1 Tax=Paraburkholderia sp. HD33-4 TaxID=2883242 RepID=UPI001F2830B4|nr:glucose-6-phosphate dehydrogenase [Paraburkholderia sp. HD33-4]